MGMQERYFSELEQRAAGASFRDQVEQLEAQARVRDQIDAMRAEGKALELSEEEVRLLESFRRFKLRMRKDGEVFKWQTRRPEGVQVVGDTALIVAPEEVGDVPRR